MTDRYTLFKELCKDLSGIYVEVGTCWGHFADHLLKSTPCSKLYCVDPYKKFDTLEYIDSLNTMTQEEMDIKYLAVQANLKIGFQDRSIMLRNISTEAAKLFDDNSLDFVYIDGNHMYEYVMDDLKAWYPKIKSGGILAGDDVESLDVKYEYGKNSLLVHEGGSFGFYGVRSALIDFQALHPEFQYTIDGHQFYWKKPSKLS